MINSLHGLVSDSTLLAQLPFITDVNEELETLKAQKEQNMSLYNFSANSASGADEEETEEDTEE